MPRRSGPRAGDAAPAAALARLALLLVGPIAVAGARPSAGPAVGHPAAGHRAADAAALGNQRMASARLPAWHLSGLTVAYAPERPAGRRIVSATLADGAPLDDDRTYTVACNDLLVLGGLAPARHTVRATSTDIVDLDALVRHPGSLPQPVRVPAEVRLRPRAAEESK